MISSIRIAGIVAMLAAGTATAAVYKWVDKDGKVHYGDRPVAGAQQQSITAPGVTPPAPSEDAPAGDADPEAAQVRANQCTAARKRLDSYEQSSTVVQRDPNGQERRLSADERVDLIVQARRDVNALCYNRSTAERPPN